MTAKNFLGFLMKIKRVFFYILSLNEETVCEIGFCRFFGTGSNLSNKEMGFLTTEHTEITEEERKRDGSFPLLLCDLCVLCG